jgi:AraC family transcriptional regulator
MGREFHGMSGAASAIVYDSGSDRMSEMVLPGEPRIVAGPEGSWSGVTLRQTEMHWADGYACHELPCQSATLWVVLEEVGGRYEHRLSRSEPTPSPRAGAMSLMPAGVELWGYARGIRFVRTLQLTFDMKAAGLVLGDRPLWPAFATPRLMFSSDPIWQITRLLAAESGKPGATDGLYGESLATALCVELLRLAGTENRPVARGGLAPWQMRRISEYMEAHLSDAIQLSDLARVAGMSRSHFSQAFRTTTGMPPHRWHLNARVRRAQELLLDTDLSLAELALETGFADQSHFTKCFQRQIGTSPGAWRRNRWSERVHAPRSA